MDRIVRGGIDYNRSRVALVVSPHADDEIIGCGGTIARSTDGGYEVEVVILGIDDEGVRLVELEAAMDTLGVPKWSVLYPGMDGYLDTLPLRKIVSDLDSIIDEAKPVGVYYSPPQHHQDHTVCFKAVTAALRPWARECQPEVIATYEIPAWYQQPSGGCMYVDITGYLAAKMEAASCYESQITENGPVSLRGIRDLAQVRGREIGREHAELFTVIRTWR